MKGILKLRNIKKKRKKERRKSGDVYVGISTGAHGLQLALLVGSRFVLIDIWSRSCLSPKYWKYIQYPDDTEPPHEDALIFRQILVKKYQEEDFARSTKTGTSVPRHLGLDSTLRPRALVAVQY
jgi:hypothetical protein